MTRIPSRPRLRPGLAAARDGSDGNYYYLMDNHRITHRVLRLALHDLNWAQLFNGSNSLHDIQRLATPRNHTQSIEIEYFEKLAARLDEALFLDSPRFHEYINGPIREPACIGCYDADPDKARQQLAAVFTAPGGPGLPAGPPADESSLRALLVPHMDFVRGNVTYGWGFRELYEKSAARLFVIIGTSHYSPARFTLTRQNFLTPFGLVETDQGFIDNVLSNYGDAVFADRMCHFPEHSIELEVIMLQFLYQDVRPFRIVPLLVGSFRDAVEAGRSPTAKADIRRMVKALQVAEQSIPEEVCYIISGDLAHIGPKFQDPEPVHEAQLRHSQKQDQRLLKHAAAVAIDEYFGVIADEQDSRRICGLPPTWTTLAAVQPRRGRLLHYQQFVHPQGYESVSFASMAFDK
jgi:AmmeMemoRadiSam system protein B